MLRNEDGPCFDRKRANTAVLVDYIDYFCGRAIECDLRGDTVDSYLYNRDMGPGAFESVVEKMRIK